MNPEWKNKLSLLHKRINENETSNTEDEHRDRHHFVREDESMRPLSFKEESVALLDPALSIYSGVGGRSPYYGHPDDSSSAARFLNVSGSMLDDADTMDNDFTISDRDRHDDSSDNVNQGTPTRREDTSGSSKSTPSSCGPRVDNQSSFTSNSGYSRGAQDSRVLDYDPYLKAVEENTSYVSDSSKEGSDRHIIKTLDFGSSVDYQHDDLSITSEKESKSYHDVPSRSIISPHLSTPPRTAAAAIGRDALGASPPPGLQARHGSALKPPIASSPASPEMTFNKTPSRIPLPSSRGAQSATRVSATQERSTSQFADALQKHGQSGGYDSDNDVFAPLIMSKTTAIYSTKVNITPQTKPSATRSDGTPSTQPGTKPPTPAPTPLQLPASRHCADTAEGNDITQRELSQCPETLAFTEGFDEWKEAWTPIGKKYYYNRRTRKSAWRLPGSAIHVKIAGELDKIFVPMERESSSTSHSDALPKNETERTRASVAKTLAEVDLLAETVISGNPTSVNQRPSAAKANAASTTKESPDWGNQRQEFKVYRADGFERTFKAPEEVSDDIEIATPSIQERPPPALDSTKTTPHAGIRSGSNHSTVESDQHEVVSEMKCKTLLFCPLCADVILPQRFGDHFNECPEIATLAQNREFNIVLSALSEGFASFSQKIRSMTAFVAPVGVTTGVRDRQQTGDQLFKRPISSPLPNRVLDFGGDGDGNNTTPQRSSSIHYDDPAGESGKKVEERSRSANASLGNSAAQNKCAFCGKPSSKSALSAHLLVCKSRKEMQLKRQISNENATNLRGNTSAGKGRIAVTHRKISSGNTPKRRNRNDLSDISTIGEAEAIRKGPAIWGASTPADSGAKISQSTGRDGRGKFISPAGVGDAINSARRAAGSVVKSGALYSAQSSSPLKATNRANSTHRGTKPLGEHQTNLGTPSRTITTRVFM